MGGNSRQVLTVSDRSKAMGQKKRSQRRQLGLITHPVVKQMITETETMDTRPQLRSVVDALHSVSQVSQVYVTNHHYIDRICSTAYQEIHKTRSKTS